MCFFKNTYVHTYIILYVCAYVYTYILLFTYHFSEFSSTSKTVKQINAEIDMHLTQIRYIGKVLPQTIIIGPFFVNCSTISQALSKKHKELAIALLDYVVSRLKKKIDEVSTSFVSSIVPYNHVYS